MDPKFQSGNKLEGEARKLSDMYRLGRAEIGVSSLYDILLWFCAEVGSGGRAKGLVGPVAPALRIAL